MIFLKLFYKIPFLQCSMCRAVLETGADAETAKSLNDGIVYLMIVPYLLIGIIGYIVYKQLTKN
jgi:hypothetical protein|tara:strand:- start:715 stop:906 length:192 start_codon:yes stop_codon:yes gene_type:complete